MVIVALILLKFLLYFGVFVATVPLLALRVGERGSFALKWAALRLGLGFIFGIAIAWAYVASGRFGLPPVSSYVLSFVVIRIIEWALMFVALSLTYNLALNRRSILFISLGVAANTAFDGLASLVDADNFKFVC